MNNQKGGSIVIGYLDFLLLSSILSVAIFGNQISKEESVKRRNLYSDNTSNNTSRSKPISKIEKEIYEENEDNIEQDKIDKTNVVRIAHYLFND